MVVERVVFGLKLWPQSEIVIVAAQQWPPDKILFQFFQDFFPNIMSHDLCHKSHKLRFMTFYDIYHVA